MPTPPRRPWTHDASPREIESRAELDHHLSLRSLRGLTLLGLRLDLDPPDLSGIDVHDALFVGCRFAANDVSADVVRRGASVVPVLPEVPYPTTPARLYCAEDLADGFARGGFEAMYDTVVFRHFTAHGGPLPDVREALGQRLHDAGIDRALTQFLRRHQPSDVIGVMGGHAALRGSAPYRLSAALARELTRAGKLIATGGGPGVMEAANLGALLASQPESALDEVIDDLATATDFRDHEPYTAAAIEVRQRYPAAVGPMPWLPGGLSIPTWLYGHEPANLFAGAIAKYFSNALREDTLLRAARGGVVFAPGWAGTVQEVFQAATLAFYRVAGDGGPLVFLDRSYWTNTVPVLSLLGPLLRASPLGDLSGRIHITDEVPDAVALLGGG